jgi:hypothetical protein
LNVNTGFIKGDDTCGPCLIAKLSVKGPLDVAPNVPWEYDRAQKGQGDAHTENDGVKNCI